MIALLRTLKLLVTFGFTIVGVFMVLAGCVGWIVEAWHERRLPQNALFRRAYSDAYLEGLRPGQLRFWRFVRARAAEILIEESQ